ncbi:hypothetical protein Neosp_002394 [[Neocosmospora] mangrovei]
MSSESRWGRDASRSKSLRAVPEAQRPRVGNEGGADARGLVDQFVKAESSYSDDTKSEVENGRLGMNGGREGFVGCGRLRPQTS